MANQVVPGKTKPPRAKMTVRDVMNELVERSNSNMRRLRVLEEETKAMKERTKAAEDTAKETKKELEKTLEDLSKRVFEESERIIKIENILKDIVSRLKRVATQGKIKELEELLDIYNPIKSQFMTREEVETLIEEKLSSK